MMRRYLVFSVLLLLRFPAAEGDSLRALRKLLQQHDEEAELKERFRADMDSWTEQFHQSTSSFMHFVENCRQPGSQCSPGKVQRQIRLLRRFYSALRMQLETLERQYEGRLRDTEVLLPALLAARQALQQYYETLRVVNAQTYKLVAQ
ncbi:uncharacterized protein LOC115629007 [Scaptodrosophila lebanonensis]|uniref:Uncharacterized protein LOC115629007 n=1 Tax=Drosophila lebanonensis TaxID=7225 RepID=A0A6J2TYF7_DROLE|nr:uncharacterized protein LOC115629007 [Scaptodrosophila lebanonensis]